MTEPRPGIAGQGWPSQRHRGGGVSDVVEGEPSLPTRMEEEAAHPKWAAIVKGEEAMAGDDESAFIASVSDAFGILQRTHV